MVICGGSVHEYRGGIICHDHLDRRGFLFSLRIRNGYEFAHRFLTWLYLVARDMNTEVASFAMIIGIEGVSFSLQA